MKAKFVQRAESIDYTPDRDIEAGEIILLNELAGITKLPIPSGTLGALAITGIFDAEKPEGISFQIGESVFLKDGSIGKDGKAVGIAAKAASENEKYVRFILNGRRDAIPLEWHTAP